MSNTTLGIAPSPDPSLFEAAMHAVLWHTNTKECIVDSLDLDVVDKLGLSTEPGCEGSRQPGFAVLRYGCTATSS